MALSADQFNDRYKFLKKNKDIYEQGLRDMALLEAEINTNLICNNVFGTFIGVLNLSHLVGNVIIAFTPGGGTAKAIATDLVGGVAGAVADAYKEASVKGENLETLDAIKKGAGAVQKTAGKEVATSVGKQAAILAGVSIGGVKRGLQAGKKLTPAVPAFFTAMDIMEDIDKMCEVYKMTTAGSEDNKAIKGQLMFQVKRLKEKLRAINIELMEMETKKATIG